MEKKNKFVELEFTKKFFARLLMVEESEIEFVMFRKYTLADYLYYPAIKVNGIDSFYFRIETGQFERIREEDILLPAEITMLSDSPFVRFSTSDKESGILHEIERSIEMADFRRTYLTRIANTFWAY